MKGKKAPPKAKRKNSSSRKVVAHIARSFAEAENWDLEFWRQQSPELRISALESIRKEYEAIKNGNNKRL